MVKVFLNGIVDENPLLILMIGLCSSLAVTTSLSNGIGMGLAMTFVLLLSELIIGMFKKLIPDSVRIPIFIIVIAAFTTMIDYLLQAYFPALSASLGLFIPLIVVNCILLGRIEVFASKEKLIYVIPDSLGMGIGYTWVLAAISLVREVLGNGSILGVRVMGESFEPILFFALPPGGFLVFAFFISLGLFMKKAMADAPVNREKAGCC